MCVVGTQKRSQWDASIENPKIMFEMTDEKIITILFSKFWLILHMYNIAVDKYSRQYKNCIG